MRYVIELEGDALTVDLEPAVFDQLVSLRSREAVSTYELASFVRQLAFYEQNQLGLAHEYPGQTIVIADQSVQFVGAPEQARQWASAEAKTPYYVVSLLDELGVTSLERTRNALKAR